MLASSCAGGAKAKDSEPETGAKAIESEANGSGPGAKDSGAVFSDVRGKEWVLAEVKGTAETIRLDRQQLEAAGFKGAYTLTFNEGLLNGTGAPNSYRGPYTAGEGRSLTIGNIAATLMMGLSEVPGIPERSYFAYLNKVARWDIREGNLELYTSDEAGAERVLVYNPK
jgi:heat shock protein HslJ